MIKDFITFCAACNELLQRKGNMITSNPPVGAYSVFAENGDTYTFSAAGMWAILHYADTKELYRYNFKGDNCFLTKNGVTIWHCSD